MDVTNPFRERGFLIRPARHRQAARRCAATDAQTRERLKPSDIRRSRRALDSALTPRRIAASSFICKVALTEWITCKSASAEGDSVLPFLRIATIARANPGCLIGRARNPVITARARQRKFVVQTGEEGRSGGVSSRV